MRQFTLCISEFIQGKKKCVRRTRFFFEIRSKAWFRARGCSENEVFRQPQRHTFRCASQLVEKAIFDFYASCGSTHSIEFALQIHKFREHVSRNLYKGRKNVPVGRGFSSVFARKRGFEREAARKTIVFRQPHKRRLFRRLLSFTVFFRCNRNDK